MTDFNDRGDFPDLLPNFQQPDPALATLVRLANRGVGISVTVNCGGRVVSGPLVSGAQWYETNADRLAAVDHGAQGNVARDAIVKVYREEAVAWREMWESNADALDAVHLHISDARTREGDQLGAWRGRLIAVTDWSIGTYVND